MLERLNLTSAGNLRRNEAQVKSSSGGGHLSLFPLRLVDLRSLAFNLTIIFSTHHLWCATRFHFRPFFKKLFIHLLQNMTRRDETFFSIVMLMTHRYAKTLTLAGTVHSLTSLLRTHVYRLKFVFCLPRPFAGPVLCFCYAMVLKSLKNPVL